MNILQNIRAFFIRSFSADYKNEIVKLHTINSFAALAKEVKDNKSNIAALLAIQDVAFEACNKRLKALSEGKRITLINEEKPV